MNLIKIENFSIEGKALLAVDKKAQLFGNPYPDMA